MGKGKLLRHQFTFYESFFDALRDLPDEQFGRLVRGMAEFSLYGDEPTYNDPTERMVWKLIRPVLSKSRNKARDQQNNKSTANGAQNERKSEQTPLIDIDVEGEGEIKAEVDTTTKKDSCSSSVSTTDDDNYRKFMVWYNETVKNTPLSKIVSMTPQRKAALDALKAEFGGEKIVEALEKAKQSDYLLGYTDNANGRRMSVDWFLNNDNLRKILEDVYSNF